MMEFDPRGSAVRANPYPYYAQLRTHDPVHYRPQNDDWIFTRYADLTALLTDKRVGYCPAKTTQEAPPMRELPAHGFARFTQLRDHNLQLTKLWIFTQNPPVHTRLFKFFHQVFNQQQFNALMPRISTQTAHLLDRLQTLTAPDIMREFAYPLTAGVISDILGIPETDRPRLKPWSQELARWLDVDVTAAARERGLLALMACTDYFQELIARCRATPPRQDHLIQRMIQAEQAGVLSESEVLAHCTVFFFAGHSTTQHLIGNGIYALLRHPDQVRLLQRTSSHMPSAIDECLRYDSPAQAISRTALTDFVWRGRPIKQGQRLHLLLGAANRDPDQFARPDNFEITRTPNRYLSFGHGMHYCMGSYLARLTAQIGIAALLERLPQLSLAPTPANPVEYEDTFLIRGLKSLPVTF